MIIIVSWYSDGSGEPDVVGIPNSHKWLDQLFEVVAELNQTSKKFRAFEVNDSTKPLVELGLHQEN